MKAIGAIRALTHTPAVTSTAIVERFMSGFYLAVLTSMTAMTLDTGTVPSVPLRWWLRESRETSRLSP